MGKAPAAVPPSRAVALLLGLGVAALLAWVGMKPTHAGVNSDAAVYLLLADWLSPWRANDAGFAAGLFARYPFPPLYPLLLAALGGGSATPLLNYAIDAALQGAAAAATFLWARRAGANKATALAAGALLALTPIALFTAMGLFSEPLYLALSMMALARVATPAPTARDWHVAAALLGLATLARGVGLFAVLALLLAWAWQTRARQARAAPLLALLPWLAWLAVKHLAGWQGGYASTLFSIGVPDALAALAAQVPTNLRALGYHALRCFDFLGGAASAWTLALLTPAAVLGWSARLRRAAPDALYAALYLAVIVAWPYPNHYPRFLLVLLPLFGAYAGLGVQALLVRSAAARHAAGLVALLLVIVVAPSCGQILTAIARADSAQARLYARIASWYAHDSRAAADEATAFALRVLDVMAALPRHVPADACVTSTMAETVMLNARRNAVAPPGARADEARLRATVAACPYVLALRATAFPALDYPFYYPFTRLGRDFDTLYAVPLDPRTAQGTALALLLRYHAPAVP